ncbi:MAG: ABC transporter permease subunit [Pseudomonadota bacterium]
MTLRGLGTLWMAFCGLVLVAPIAVVSAAALNGGRTMTFPPVDPTLARFADFFLHEPVWVRALTHSVVIALGAALIATLIAWPVAYQLWRRADGVSRALAGLAALPFALPPIVFGVGLGFLWTFGGGLGSVWAGILSHAMLFAALPLTTISIGLQAIDRAHLEAAATMGASERVAFRTIVLPQTLPYTMSGFLFALILSFNEFIVVFFVAASSYATVTLQIFNSLRNGFTPTMAVAAILFITVSLAVFAAVGRFGNLPRLMGADDVR